MSDSRKEKRNDNSRHASARLLEHQLAADCPLLSRTLGNKRNIYRYELSIDCLLISHMLEDLKNIYEYQLTPDCLLVSHMTEITNIHKDHLIKNHFVFQTG